MLMAGRSAETNQCSSARKGDDGADLDPRERAPGRAAGECDKSLTIRPVTQAQLCHLSARQLGVRSLWPLSRFRLYTRHTNVMHRMLTPIPMAISFTAVVDQFGDVAQPLA